MLHGSSQNTETLRFQQREVLFIPKASKQGGGRTNRLPGGEELGGSYRIRSKAAGRFEALGGGASGTWRKVTGKKQDGFHLFLKYFSRKGKQRRKIRIYKLERSLHLVKICEIS